MECTYVLTTQETALLIDALETYRFYGPLNDSENLSEDMEKRLDSAAELIAYLSSQSST